MTELDRIIAEQKLAVANIAREPDSRGARLGLADWVAEEVLIMAEPKPGDRFYGTSPSGRPRVVVVDYVDNGYVYFWRGDAGIRGVQVGELIRVPLAIWNSARKSLSPDEVLLIAECFTPEPKNVVI